MQPQLTRRIVVRMRRNDPSCKRKAYFIFEQRPDFPPFFTVLQYNLHIGDSFEQQMLEEENFRLVKKIKLTNNGNPVTLCLYKRHISLTHETWEAMSIAMNAAVANDNERLKFILESRN